MNPFPRRVLRTAATLAVATAGTVVPLVVSSAPADAITLSPSGTVVVTLRGNGHGHGMSQYGAEGAAGNGLSYGKILGFYYPGTTLTTLAKSQIRVRLSGFPARTTVAAYSTIAATGVGTLPTRGVAKYRLVASGSGLALQQLKSAKGATWRTYRGRLANRTELYRTNGYSTRLYRSDGSSVRYIGRLRAVRAGSGLYTVNRVSLDSYTAGVVPSEMPVSWRAQAVNAQAVAARTYGRYAVEHRATGSEYDICDTTQCQVYGGRKRYDRGGHVVGGDYQPAAKATANRVLRYRGSTIFAQFSASNGGWSAGGGQPYLTARADPYDPSAAGNPYIDYRRTVSVRSLASYFGLAKVTKLAVTKRDGHGTWGGRVLAATLTGTSSSGKATTRRVTGFDLQYAIGAGTTWFTVRRG
ncbi:SpoIID/LytB domain protein [Jatrophihabitans endophyticus]|uniref:SpoIID/LytB domain protein n=1 Tax=Jatrophihabitans endophyticus TaxID=1206085 RepID=A0A1M5RJQ5_9ACTN|nr:SpoIID/LytB domain-containing protein [Jatrophihabitans endophyticus]SHH26612.1 SpoIID/LytB domain protein [Jatrophihabitans endophyticus]